MLGLLQNNAEDLLDSLNDDSADLLDLVESDIDALEQEIEELRTVKDSLESIRETTKDVTPNQLGEEDVRILTKRFKKIDAVLDRAQELEQDVLETDSEEQTEVSQAKHACEQILRQLDEDV